MSSEIPREPQRRQRSKGKNRGQGCLWPGPTPGHSEACCSRTAHVRPGPATCCLTAQVTDPQETRSNHKTDWTPSASSVGREGLARKLQEQPLGRLGQEQAPPPWSPPNPQGLGDFIPRGRGGKYEPRSQAESQTLKYRPQDTRIRGQSGQLKAHQRPLNFAPWGTRARLPSENSLGPSGFCCLYALPHYTIRAFNTSLGNRSLALHPQQSPPPTFSSGLWRRQSLELLRALPELPKLPLKADRLSGLEEGSVAGPPGARL